MGSIVPFGRQGRAFDDATARAMGEAFDEACEHLGRNLPLAIQEAVARRIIEAAGRGERDPQRLCRVAIGASGR